LGNNVTLALGIPSGQDRNRYASGAELDDLVKPGQVNAAGLARGGPQVIHCQRVGMHLKVPVRLDIHGVEVKCSMLLDTGASLIVLPKSVYNRGLARPLSGLRRIRLKTANGPMTCPVDRLHVSTTAYGKTLSVALSNDSTSLLGANYFLGYRITIDLDRECIFVHSAEKQ
jgi:predicted aspartyl protease